LLNVHMPGATIGTIVVDSLTAILRPLVDAAVLANDEYLRRRAAGSDEKRNLVAAFKQKAVAMGLLQYAISQWGTDVLWIFHTTEARDEKANLRTRDSLTPTERVRLLKTINLQLEVVLSGNKRGVKVVWARQGRAGMTLWDEAGYWRGMPERIEETVYGNLSPEEQEQIAAANPQAFPDMSTAQAWGVEQGAFNAIQHAQRAWAQLWNVEKPKSLTEFAPLWMADVQRRVAEQSPNGNGGGHWTANPARVSEFMDWVAARMDKNLLPVALDPHELRDYATVADARAAVEAYLELPAG